MAPRRNSWHEPVSALLLGIAEVRTSEGSIVGVGRVLLTNEREGSIDFAACASVAPPAGVYVLKLASGRGVEAALSGTGPRMRLVLA
jgi:hypothetical protein